MRDWFMTHEKGTWTALAGLFLLMAVLSGAFWFFDHRGRREAEERLGTAFAEGERLKAELASTSAALAAEYGRNERFAAEVGQMQGAVETLDKLFKTDPELLRRYSQVYFLPDNYEPAALSEINKTYWADPDRPQKFHAGAKGHLEDMLKAASSSGVVMRVVSGYRSFGEQSTLKQRYALTYGTGANKFSADQGYSEHQLGTAADLTTPALGGLSGFEGTKAYGWLKENAHRYGFILSYPENNAYYQFEPWHWRFVGIKLAAYLEKEDKTFATLAQREINAYLIDLFE